MTIYSGAAGYRTVISDLEKKMQCDSYFLLSACAKFTLTNVLFTHGLHLPFMLPEIHALIDF